MSCLQFPRPSSLLAAATPLCAKAKGGDLSYRLLLGNSATSVNSDTSYAFSSKKELDRLPKVVSLNFYMEDGSYRELVVEENLRALDLCQILALKINVARSRAWNLVEQINPLGIERTLEDHEDVLKVYATWGPQTKATENKFIFRQDFCKYEFFHVPQQFFPLSILDLEDLQLDCLSESTDFAKFVTLQNILNSGEKTPAIQSLLWCKEPEKDTWKRLFFRVEDNILCISSSSNNVKDPKNQLWPFRDLKEHDIYTPSENKRMAAPTAHTFCLKPVGNIAETTKNILWLCSESEQYRQCWVIVLRLAKFGKLLHENYKEVQAQYAGSPSTSASSATSSPPEAPHSDYTPMKPRVAMDFTGIQSRVVDDPGEAKAIAAAEGHTWKRRLPCCRTTAAPPHQNYCQNLTSRLMEFGVHSIQPWFYSGMSRDEATQLLTKYGTVDGVFLVRESRSNPGSFVLSYVYSHKVHHCQIFPVEEKEQLCYSLDNGRTKFYDLLQLVEFYQLNLGCLPTKLTHFLVHRPRQTTQMLPGEKIL